MEITNKTKCDNCKRTLKNKRVRDFTIFDCNHILCNKCRLKTDQQLTYACRICFIEKRKQEVLNEKES
jgi:hypothetical protein